MTNKETYLKFCKKEKEIAIFSQPWYLDITCGEKNWDVLLVQKGTEIVASMPFLKNSFYGFSLSRMPLITGYLGPYFPKKFGSAKQQQLMKTLIHQFPKCDFFEQNFHPSFQDWLPFYWEKFEGTVFYTFVIEPLDDLEKIYKNIHSDYRNNKIPKAKSIVQIHSDFGIEKFYQTLQKTFARQGLKAPCSLDFLKRYDAVLEKQHARKIFFAVDKDHQIHSAVYLIWDETTAYFHMAGNDPDLRKSGAGILIIWHVIKYAKEVLGKDRFDFEGSIIEPITRIRQNFGAEQTPYLQVRRFNSRLAKFLYEIKKKS